MSAAALRVSAILAAGGRGLRLGGGTPKQLRRLGSTTMLEASARALQASPLVRELVVAVPAESVQSDHAERLRAMGAIVVAGGARRQDSVALAFDHVSQDADVVLVHDAARPFVSRALVERVVQAAADTGAAIAALAVHDTVKLTQPGPAGPIVSGTIDRSVVFLAQTPQAFRREVLARAVALGRDGAEATDEAMLVERTGVSVRVVDGEPANRKITTDRDWTFAEANMSRGWPEGAGMAEQRVGIGYDLHRLVSGRPLKLGGVTVPHFKGLLGHSDGDAVCHAVTDAVLGAARAGDIGILFPDTDPRWKDADSIALLRAAVERVRQLSYRVVNVDVVVIAELPKIAPYRDAMAARLAEALGVGVECVSVKGKTNEGCGEVGRGEAIAVQAMALLERDARAYNLDHVEPRPGA